MNSCQFSIINIERCVFSVSMPLLSISRRRRKKEPDRTLHNDSVSESSVRRFWAAWNSMIHGFWGFEIAICLVRGRQVGNNRYLQKADWKTLSSRLSTFKWRCYIKEDSNSFESGLHGCLMLRSSGVNAWRFPERKSCGRKPNLCERLTWVDFLSSISSF